MNDGTDIPAPSYDKPRSGLSIIWIMPLLAVLIAAGVVWQTFQERGPLILVKFPAAEGIEEGVTILKYRDVKVGEVESVEFSADLNHVDVSIRLERKIAPFVDARAQFWLVKPEVSTRGITGLTTVLSGIYIEGRWDNIPGPSATDFTALTRRPLAAPGEVGTNIVLNSRNGRKLSFGAPILFNGIEVGKIGTPSLSADGLSVSMPAFIAAPHDSRLTTATSFWDSSGISLGLGSGGVSVDIDSLAALIEGGISFGTLISGGRPIRPGHVFEIYENEDEARSNVLIGRNQFEAAVLLDADVVGLSKGAQVTFRGLKIGEVSEIAGFVAPGGNPDFVQLLAGVSLNLARLGIAETDEAAALSALAARVDAGLRAQVSAQGLLGRTLSIDLQESPDSPVAALRTDLTDRPVIPSLPADLDGRTDTLDGLITRVDKLPIEDLLASAINVMDSITELAASTDTRAIPSQAFDLLTDMRALVGSEDLAQGLRDLQAAAADIKTLSNNTLNSPGLESLLTALERSETIAKELEAAAKTLPELSARADRLVQSLSDLPLSNMTEETRQAIAAATQTVNSIKELTTSEDTRAIPTQAFDLLSEMRALVGSQALTQGISDLQAAAADIKVLSNSAVNSPGLNTLLKALERSETIAKELERTALSLPDLSANAAGFIQSLSDLPLTNLTEETRGVVATAGALLSDEDLARLAPDLAKAIASANAALTDLQADGAITKLNRAIGGAEALMQDLRTSAGQIDPIFTQIDTILSDIDAMPLAEIGSSSQQLLQRLDTVLSAEGIETIPVTLSETLEEMRTVLKDLRTGGAVAALNATLSDAQSAFDAVNSAASSLPGLARQFSTVATQAEQTLKGYSENSRFNRDLNAAIKAANDALSAIRSLARKIERNPSSLITGR